MNTIVSYIENLFSSFPDSEDARKLKKSLLDSSQDRYYDLKNQGKSENEAVGAVISEFGGIDEIKMALNIDTQTNRSENTIYMDEKAAADCVNAAIKSSILVAIGVFFCISSAATFLLVDNLAIAEGLSTGIMLVMIAIGVIIFIVSSSLYDDKTNFKKQPVSLSNSAKLYLKRTIDDSRIKKTVLLSLGILMLILSPIIILVNSASSIENISSAVMLFWIALGVSLIIISSEPEDVSKRLLRLKQNEDCRAMSNRGEKINGIFNAILWPIATLVFLYIGFVHGSWHPSWVIFPICGILSGIVGSVSTIIFPD